jgi:hypothetical protein
MRNIQEDFTTAFHHILLNGPGKAPGRNGCAYVNYETKQRLCGVGSLMSDDQLQAIIDHDLNEKDEDCSKFNARTIKDLADHYPIFSDFNNLFYSRLQQAHDNAYINHQNELYFYERFREKMQNLAETYGLKLIYPSSSTT